VQVSVHVVTGMFAFVSLVAKEVGASVHMAVDEEGSKTNQ